MSQMQFSITSEFQTFKDKLLALTCRVNQNEVRINDHERSLYGNGPIDYKLKELTHSLERLGEQMIKANANINELQVALSRLSQLQPATDAIPVEPKEKSDLEIFEQNIDDSIKNNYIDLDEIANGKELWEPYDANWWNK